MAGEVIYRLVSAYAHVFFAVYIFMTALEAYKGQTPGKYLKKIRVIKTNGGKISLLESAIRNGGKFFLLLLDVIIGLLFFSKKGYLRFFDYYIEAVIEKMS
ncbi:MAG: RDD family protein [Aigarchaeota archaeon]|nr:RDD family protein [Candidatus Pelearchaeum maunauluense]